MNRTERRTSHQTLRTTLLTILFLVGLGSVVSAQAQWTASGNDINNTNSGNVGIGTASPSTLFEVLKDQNGPTGAKVSNGFAGTSAFAYLQATSGPGS